MGHFLLTFDGSHHLVSIAVLSRLYPGTLGELPVVTLAVRAARSTSHPGHAASGDPVPSEGAVRDPSHPAGAPAPSPVLRHSAAVRVHSGSLTSHSGTLRSGTNYAARSLVAAVTGLCPYWKRNARVPREMRHGICGLQMVSRNLLSWSVYLGCWFNLTRRHKHQDVARLSCMTYAVLALCVSSGCVT